MTSHFEERPTICKAFVDAAPDWKHVTLAYFDLIAHAAGSEQAVVAASALNDAAASAEDYALTHFQEMQSGDPYDFRFDQDQEDL